MKIRAIVAINLNNPTGNILRRKDIKDIVKINYENK